MNEDVIYPVILSGGSGTRLWPLSREHYPKQLLELIGQGTMLQQTIARLRGMPNVEAPIAVCNEEHRFIVGEQARQIESAFSSIILEPVGRNTCPAATLAALLVARDLGRGLVLIMPADHVIRDTKAFQRAISEGIALARDGRLVTFGVVPTTAATGYGYIKCGPNSAVMEFVEKPDEGTARRYLESGNYLWNSGMFLMRADAWLEELRHHAPEILAECEAAVAGGRRDGEFFRVDVEAFRRCRSDSIDYAVMEKTERSAVIPLDAGWSDVGAWSTIWDVSNRDASGNVAVGDVSLHNVRDSLVISKHRLVALVGVDKLVVIETPDAVLVAHQDVAQDVKYIVEDLKKRNRTEHIMHRRVHRPWGSYEGIDDGERFQVKRLMVNPGAALSLQMHHHRAEHWVVVRGTARVTRGDEVFMITENQSTYIPLGTKHRLENPGTIPLELVEVQSGSYLGEDDIVRFEDRYNRSV